MEQMSLREIVEATGGMYSGEERVIAAVSSDTRDLPEGCLFIALKGDRFDGHAFVGKALEQGAAVAVVSDDVEAPPGRVLRVQDTRQAYLDIAGLYRRMLGLKVVGITGSVGKTTTKEMIACVCAAGFSTLKTEMNLNNEVGLSQMLLRLTPEHRVAVLEMGMDGPGQIAPLSRSAAPDIGVVTNIGVSHLEALGSRENIRDEKLDIRAGIGDSGVLVLNGDDDMLAPVEDPRLTVMRYGIDSPDCMVRGSRIKEFSSHTTFEVAYDGNRFDAQIPSMGKHNVYNALAALCVGIALDIPLHKAIAALRNYRPAGMRQRIVVHNSFTVVEDCYNASPDSMRAALETLGHLKCDGKRIAVLSDMLELGSVAEQSHRETGHIVAECGADVLLCTGELARLYQQGAREKGMGDAAMWFPDKAALYDHLKSILQAGDIAWFKASRGMRLEEVIERIYREI
ncbi:UDP-N-acetylmuramoyl-tripeptide--D-alanyl-D-alanine ligase [Ruminococcaceae bacterium OttesenSCG-928-L11]|nr:UDP-N-acetylmuramoyl-tripeptide--D-alanyl-D-alanine ligase [Ruminococcaceae bacterium OttesenSCG-928-L11]